LALGLATDVLSCDAIFCTPMKKKTNAMMTLVFVLFECDPLK
jgi:hypothetical protein